MSRKTNTVEWFPHYANASSKMTLTILEKKYGTEGYACWFKLLECLAQSDGHYISCQSTTQLEYLKCKLPVSNGNLMKILQEMADLSAIDKELWENQKIIWSDNFIQNVKEVYTNRRREIPLKPVINTQLTNNLQVTNNQHSHLEELERGEEVEELEEDIDKSSTNSVTSKNKTNNITYVKTDENGEPIKEKVKKVKKQIDPLAGEKAKEVFVKLDSLRGYVVGNIRGGENKSVLRMLKNYSPEQIIKVWQMMKSEEFWKTKELSLMSVEKQIGAKLQFNPQSIQPQVDRMEGMRTSD
jgi:Domain of unknown function (DUF4373)